MECLLFTGRKTCGWQTCWLINDGKTDVKEILEFDDEIRYKGDLEKSEYYGNTPVTYRVRTTI